MSSINQVFSILVLVSLFLFPSNGKSELFAGSLDSPNSPLASTWGISNSFLVLGGSVNIRWSNSSYTHKARTSGYAYGNQPIQIQAKVYSYATTNLKPYGCQQRTSSLVTGYGQISVESGLASATDPGCSGTPGSGYHRYYGKGYHWTGGYYGETDVSG